MTIEALIRTRVKEIPFAIIQPGQQLAVKSKMRDRIRDELLLIYCNDDDSGGEVRVVFDWKNLKIQKSPDRSENVFDKIANGSTINYEVEADIPENGNYSRPLFLPGGKLELVLWHRGKL